MKFADMVYADDGVEVGLNAFPEQSFGPAEELTHVLAAKTTVTGTSYWRMIGLYADNMSLEEFETIYHAMKF